MAFRVLGIWNLVWSTRLLLSLWTDSQQYGTQLSAFGAVLAILYLASASIQLLGIVSVGLRRLPRMQIYAFLSFLSSFLIVASRALRVLVHSVIKDTVIHECAKLIVKAPINFREGIWSPYSALRQIDFTEASSWCSGAWHRDTIWEIFFLFVEIATVALIVALAVWYQPTSAALENAEYLGMRAPDVFRGRFFVAGGASLSPEEQKGLLDAGESSPSKPKDGDMLVRGSIRL